MENDYEKQGITFKIIPPEMIPDVCDFMWENFVPDEPLLRSLGAKRSKFMDEGYFGDAMLDGSSMVALDKEGKILAVRLGMRKWRSKWLSKLLDRFMYNIPQWMLNLILPADMAKSWPISSKLFNKIEYNVWRMFDVCGCDLIYEDKAVCSARSSGVKGLGTEMCRRTENLAKELGCTHTYALVTGNYSRKIFEKLGHTILTELAYADFKDENGELYLKDTREHVSVTTWVKELK